MVSSDDPDALRSLQRELNLLCKLRSKYVVQLFGSVVENRDQASFSHYNGTPFFKLKISQAPVVVQYVRLPVEMQDKHHDRGSAQGLMYIPILRSTRKKNNCGDESD